MIQKKDHIIIDQFNTWPKDFLAIVKSKEEILEGFINEQLRIDRLARTDINLRYNRPLNKFKEDWEKTIADLEEILKNYRLIGLHCTRITEEEIKNIKKNGLKPLNKDFANKRIISLFEKSIISKELKELLIDKEDLTDEFRTGKVYVFHCISNLREEHSLNKLFGYWGGEAIFMYLKSGKELKNIGKPCIVFASLKIDELDFLPLLSERMISIYFNNNYYEHDTDTSIQEEVEVVKIITADDPEFEDLTNISSWDNKF